MDLNRIAEILKATIDPNQREAAEKQLDAVHKIIGFLPTVLQVVMNNGLEGPVRQSAAIYLKNAIIRDWDERETPAGQPMEYSIHEQDKCAIRDNIVDAVVMAPDNLRVHLGTCVNHIVKYDFPSRWTGIIDKVSVYLQMPERGVWGGCLVALYQLVKNFEYKTGEDRVPMDEAMQLLLPLMKQRLVELLPDDSDASLLIQKQILKIFYAFLQYHLPQKLLTRPVFLEWMEILKQIMERPIPPRVQQVDPEEQESEPAWKCKKWALHILARVFERYGSPGSAHKEYREFAEWYIKTFSSGIITALLKILEDQANQKFVSSRVLQQTLNYISTAVNNAFSWKLVKQHINLIVQNILFPLLCYSKDDQELWETDPQEYIRLKFDVFEDYVSPVTAAQTLLHTVCKKRKDMLEKTLGFVVQVLNTPSSEARMIDGALHMVGSVADILLKKQTYKDQMESMLVSYVFPHFNSPSGYLRARACWVLHYFADTRFQNEVHLLTALELTQKCLLQEQDLPVKVEAAICFQALVSSQDRIQRVAEQNITSVALEMIKVIKDTENEDLTSVMQKLICLYSERLVPIAVEMTQQLALTFEQLTSGDSDESEDKALTAMGLLNTIDTILTMMDDQRDVQTQLEPIVVRIVVSIFQSEVIDLYEEALNLVCTISMNAISTDLWALFELMYQVFNKDGMDYFTEMMPALHNFVTVDPQAFISNRNRLLALYNMSKSIMNSEIGEDAESHAAKLIECMILQFKGQIDDCIQPFVELALSRLTRDVKTAELRTMCLQVVIAALWYNPQLLLHVLQKLQPPNTSQPLFNHFFKQWMDDMSCFQGLHDRKMCVLGLMTLIRLPPDTRPTIVTEMMGQIVPSVLLLFDGLKVAYQAKATADNQSESGSEETEASDQSDPEDLEDDQDHITATMDDVEDDEDFSDADTDSDEDYEQTALESYTTTLDDDDAPDDEYVLFKDTMETLRQSDTSLYEALVSPLTPAQHKSLSEIYTLAQQRKAASESRKIEKGGGYKFDEVIIPNSFNFGGKPIG